MRASAPSVKRSTPYRSAFSRARLRRNSRLPRPANSLALKVFPTGSYQMRTVKRRFSQMACSLRLIATFGVAVFGASGCKGDPGPPGPPGPSGSVGPVGSAGTCARPDGAECLAVRRVPLPVGHSGYEACASETSRFQQCALVTLADPHIKDDRDQHSGTAFATCNTRIVREPCTAGRKYDYTWKNLLETTKPTPGTNSMPETTACKVDPPQSVGGREIFPEVTVWCVDVSPPALK